MSKIDVWEIASEIEKVSVPEVRKELETFVNSLDGKSIPSSEIIQEVVIPLIGISSSGNKKFTLDVIQAVVDELQKEK